MERYLLRIAGQAVGPQGDAWFVIEPSEFSSASTQEFAERVDEGGVRGDLGHFCGQRRTCIAGSRWLLQDSVHDAFVEKGSAPGVRTTRPLETSA